MGCPGALYGVNNEGVRDKAAVGITEEPGVVAVDFVDKLLILFFKKKKNRIEVEFHTYE